MGLMKQNAGPYDAEVNKGSTNMAMLAARLNKRYQDGWRLHTIFEQGGNTVMVFEKA